MVFGGLEKFTLIDFPGKIACMVYTIGCNFRCPYCHNPELVDETTEVNISEEELFRFLKKRQNVLHGVVVTGGEPTIHDDLPEVLKKIKDLGFLVKLDTNGTKPKMLKEILKRGLVDYIAMDIKSPLSKYTQVAARPVDTDAIRKSIALIMASGIMYEFRTTLVKGILSESDLENIAKEIKGAKKYVLQKFISTKILNPQFVNKVSYTDDELDRLQMKLSPYVELCATR